MSAPCAGVALGPLPADDRASSASASARAHAHAHARVLSEDAAQALRVEPLRVAHIDAVAALLARSFFNTPTYTNMIVQPERRLRSLADLFARNLRTHLPYRCTYVLIERTPTQSADDENAGSLRDCERVLGTVTIKPPGGVPISFFTMLRRGLLPFAWRNGLDAARRLIAVKHMNDDMDAVQTGGGSEPHWHVHMMAIDAGQQGRGLGALLLRTALARTVDAAPPLERLRTTLGTNEMRNVVFYSRLGFVVSHTNQLAPPRVQYAYTNWSMFREPVVGADERAAALARVALEPLRAAHIDAAAALLARALFDDAPQVMLAPYAGTRFAVLRDLYVRTLRLLLPHGCVHVLVSDGAVVGTAALLPPGGAPGMSLLALLRAGVLSFAWRHGWRAVQRLVRVMALYDRVGGAQRSGDAPHWRIDHVAVHGALRGAGLGTRLVQHLLARAARAGPHAGAPVLLTTHSERNVRFYERLGFELTDTQHVPHAVFCMRRVVA